MDALDLGLQVDRCSFSSSLGGKRLSKWISHFQLYAQSGTQLKLPLIRVCACQCRQEFCPKGFHVQMHLGNMG